MAMLLSCILGKRHNPKKKKSIRDVQHNPPCAGKILEWNIVGIKANF